MPVGADSVIYLVGITGSGKSTVGEVLAARMTWRFVDLDERIEVITRRKIDEIFNEEGEEAFRMYEKAVLQSTEKISSTVVACGGGAILLPENRRWLKTQTVVWLQVDPREAIRRLGDAIQLRPLLKPADDPAQVLRELLKVRKELYREVSKIQVKTGGLDPGAVAFNIQLKLGFTADFEADSVDLPHDWDHNDKF